jgi:uncharacterized protein YraI
MGITTRLRLGWCVPLLVFSAVAMADNAMTTEDTDLYAGPDDSYPVVAELDSNSPIQVMGCLDDWSWCDVVADDTRGWMYAPDITYAYEGGYVPLYTYAPSLGIAVVPFTLDVYWGRYYHGRPWFRERDEWAHREIHHRRPPGPPPSAGPPPRPEHREGPRVAERPDNRPLHLGRAEPSRQAEPPRREERAPPDDRNMLNRPEPPRAAEPPRPHEAPRPAEPPRPEAQHAAPPPRELPHEEHGRPAREPPPAREERRRDEPPR